jgi:hypothetical protein
VHRERIAKLLASSLGLEKSVEAIDSAAATLGLPEVLAPREALRLLEHLARAPGLVGISARFVKARLILQLQE